MLGLPWHAWSIDGVEYYGAIGYLKAGLQLADRITTVSPTYAAEIRTPEGGMGLDGLLRHRAHALRGILNGIDDAVWNPATDPHLPARFDAAHRARARPRIARRCARACGLDATPEAPLFGVVSRFSWQKGMDLVLAVHARRCSPAARSSPCSARGDPGLEERVRRRSARASGSRRRAASATTRTSRTSCRRAPTRSSCRRASSRAA